MKPILKTAELLQKIREHVLEGTYVITAHALERQNLRQIDLKHVLYVLKNGKREEDKDLFDIKKQDWKYAIRGKTIEQIDLRIIIAFEEEMIIITVMRMK